MPHIRIQNVRQELVDDCAWTSGYVEISSGDICVEDSPFATYIVACYPNSNRPPNFIINAVDQGGRATMSIPFEYHSANPQAVKVLSATSSPWLPDGIIVGSIPEHDELPQYALASQLLAVASELVLVEPLLLSHARGA